MRECENMGHTDVYFLISICLKIKPYSNFLHKNEFYFHENVRLRKLNIRFNVQ